MTAVSDWLALRDRTRSDMEAQPGASVTPDVGYERIEGVDRISTPDGHWFFAGDALQVVYVSGALGPAAPVLAELGPGEELASRAGKRSVLHVWPDRGLAASVGEDEEVEFVEVFAPTTLDGYRDRIYEEPQPHLM